MSKVLNEDDDDDRAMTIPRRSLFENDRAYKHITLNYPKSAATGFFSKGLKNKLKTAVKTSHQCSSH